MLPDVVARALPLLLCAALATYGQLLLVERYLHVLVLDAGQIGPDEQVSVLAQYVDRSRRSICFGWRARCLLRVSTAASVRRTVLRLPFVFGSPRNNRPLRRVSVRLTRNRPLLRSVSSHFRPKSSPCRRPVWTART